MTDRYNIAPMPHGLRELCLWNVLLFSVNPKIGVPSFAMVFRLANDEAEALAGMKEVNAQRHPPAEGWEMHTEQAFSVHPNLVQQAYDALHPGTTGGGLLINQPIVTSNVIGQEEVREVPLAPSIAPRNGNSYVPRPEEIPATPVEKDIKVAYPATTDVFGTGEPHQGQLLVVRAMLQAMVEWAEGVLKDDGSMSFRECRDLCAEARKALQGFDPKAVQP